MSHRQLWPEGFQIKVKVIQVHAHQAALHQFNTTYGYIDVGHQHSNDVTNINKSSQTLTPMGHSKKRTSFGTDLAHVIDVTESLKETLKKSLIIGNENVDQNVQLEWEIFFYQWTVWA